MPPRRRDDLVERLPVCRHDLRILPRQPDGREREGNTGRGGEDGDGPAFEPDASQHTVEAGVTTRDDQCVRTFGEFSEFLECRTDRTETNAAFGLDAQCIEVAISPHHDRNL